MGFKIQGLKNNEKKLLGFVHENRINVQHWTGRRKLIVSFVAGFGYHNTTTIHFQDYRCPLDGFRLHRFSDISPWKNLFVFYRNKMPMNNMGNTVSSTESSETRYIC